MIKFGRKHGEYLLKSDLDGPFDTLLGATFYDAQRVFLQIGDYLKEPIWTRYADRAMAVYRDRYVLKHEGAVLGFWNFTRGLAMHYLRTGDPESRKAVKLLAEKGSYGSESTPLEWTASFNRSREVAYQINAKLDAESVGEPRSPKLAKFVDQALGHLDQWFVAKTAEYMQPFMVGLTAEALIAWDAKTPDPRVLPALKTAAASLWNHMWVKKEHTFLYIDRERKTEGSPRPVPDLNLMICPLYAWIYHRTGDVRYRDRAVAIFAGGVDGAWLDGVKMFNQNYRWAFDYVRWINAKPTAS